MPCIRFFAFFFAIVITVLSHHDGNKGPGSFLSDLTDDQRTAFFNIVKNQNLTKAETQSQLQAWATSIGGSVLEGFNNATTERQQMFAEFQQQTEQRLANNTAALQVYQQIEAVQNNQDLTNAAECQQIQSILNSTIYAVYQELQFFARCGFGGLYGSHGDSGSHEDHGDHDHDHDHDSHDHDD